MELRINPVNPRRAARQALACDLDVARFGGIAQIGRRVFLRGRLDMRGVRHVTQPKRRQLAHGQIGKQPQESPALERIHRRAGRSRERSGNPELAIGRDEPTVGRLSMR